MRTLEELGEFGPTVHCGSILLPATQEEDNLNYLKTIRNEVMGLDWISKKSARHEYFMSHEERVYSYGNRNTGDESYNSKPFSPRVSELCDIINEFILDTKFNVCFLNKYDNEQQHLGWHSDDFDGMDPDEPIGVVSFGASREIWVKPKDEKGIVPPDQRIMLDEGSLFVMPAGYQDTHLHKIPKHDRPCDYRISLTFRTFL